LFLNDTVQAIIYSDTRDLSSAHYGIIQLSSETLMPKSSHLFPSAIKYEAENRNARVSYNNNRPAVIADEANVYIGFPQSGILVVSSNGNSRILNEENGLASNNIREMQLLDGKLYAVIGAQYGDSGLMEVDLKSGVSTILFSTKSKELKKEIDGKPIRGIAADSARHGLWMIAGERNGFRQLYLFYPRDGNLRRVENASIRSALLGDAEEFNSLRKLSDDLVIGGYWDVVTINTKTEMASLLLSTIERPSAKSKWWKYFPWEKIPGRYIPVKEGLIGLNSSELLYFHDGEKNPEYLEKYLQDGNPLHAAIRDMALTKKGLLVLTDDTLYCFPEIVEK